ncbi:polysaccharide deacetylase family protein [Bdellovibrio svalbardensis]|uniref:NodB homology domain-containing protein n=1 Tax=Bdellovibrio svalbardensis TaxID=2972972 RepID=A0ABT6DL89_9BACT|nr:hypothetical protein [Bdellovibrio svalbardensis]MDG0817344.1 hypothetical protein [Bdellovibrio svalbardensis]
MNEVYFTFDYELFFGEDSGTVENCLIKPTERLISIGERTGAKFTFFVDAGFLIKMKNEIDKFPHLRKDFEAVSAQLTQLSCLGHSIQLHIHPHWEDSYYDGQKWVNVSKRYRLHDFSQEQIYNIAQQYRNVLLPFNNAVFAYRAGGWCLQPFDKIQEGLKAAGVVLDSSVFKDGLLKTPTHFFDFRGAPFRSTWRFRNNPIVEDKSGDFIEMPISSLWVSPIFYWRFLFSRLTKKAEFKIFGDGRAIGSSAVDKIKMLLIGGVAPVSVDGFRAALLNGQARSLFSKGLDKLVVIGHPKALSEYSLLCLEKFIEDSRNIKFLGFERKHLLGN